MYTYIWKLFVCESHQLFVYMYIYIWYIYTIFWIYICIYVIPNWLTHKSQLAITAQSNYKWQDSTKHFLRYIYIYIYTCNLTLYIAAGYTWKLLAEETEQTLLIAIVWNCMCWCCRRDGQLKHVADIISWLISCKLLFEIEDSSQVHGGVLVP